MRSRRAQLVTVCQHSLVTGVVLAVAASAAGVRTLDIVPTPGRSAESAGSFTPGEADLLRQRALQATVQTAPVEPQVREIAVDPLEPERGSARSAPPVEPAPEPAEVEDAEPAPAEDAAAPVDSAALTAVSEPAQVRGYGTVGVTWSAQGPEYGDDDIRIELRTETDGTWSDWSPAEYHDEHGPDGAEAQQAAPRAGTDAVVVGDVDRVQMRARTLDGTTPRGLSLAVIDSGLGQTDEAAPAIDTAALAPADGTAGAASAGSAEVETAEGADDTVALNAMRVAPRPKVFSRAQWGANEKLRGSKPSYGTVQTGFIHHTVNANGYTQDQVPALLRGIYAYHTQSRGWSDIGYNVLVDRFGRIWEGRYGGLDRAVVGAHTLGYNEVSFAMSAIGNFDTAAAPQAVVNAYSAFFAWKLSLAGIKANTARITVKGRTFQAINGHRDAGSTACPGRYLYAKLPAIRTAAAKIQNGAAPAPAPTPTPTPPPAPTPPATFVSPTQQPQAWAAQPGGITFPEFRNLAGAEAYPDLVLKRSDGVISVLPTTGQTGFSGAVRTAGSWRGYDLVVAVGDVTGDGRGDVVARNKSSRTSFVFAGDGTGRFASRGTATNGFPSARSIAAAGDWNRDGRGDLLVVTSRDRLAVFAGNGAGRFTALRTLGSWKGYGPAAAVGDLTGDGVGDLAAQRAGYLWTIPVTAQGALRPAVRQRQLGNSTSQVLGSGGDLTGDGIGDVVLRDRATGAVSLAPGVGSGQLGANLGPFTVTNPMRTVSVAPVSGSAHGDIVGVSPRQTHLVTAQHNGRSNLGGMLPSNLRQRGATQLLSVGDWNGDGKADLITRQDSGDALVLRLGQGGGAFGELVRLGSGWKSVTGLSAVGDITGDGHPDLVGKPGSAPFVVYPGDGGKGLLAPRRLPATIKTFHMVGTGSWSTAGKFSRMTSSDGSFVPKAGSFSPALSGYDWVLGLGDVDGDGRADVVARSGSALWLLPGTGTGLSQRRLIGTGFAGYHLAG